MPEVNVQVRSISGEKLLESGETSQNQIQINTNVNIRDLKREGETLKVPFVVTIGYNPSVAQINLKGEARVSGKNTELEDIENKYEENEQPPQFLVQTIVNHSIMEATIISRSLQIPPPIPFPNTNPQDESGDSEGLNYVG